jgi:hypothetical protein
MDRQVAIPLNLSITGVEGDTLTNLEDIAAREINLLAMRNGSKLEK